MITIKIELPDDQAAALRAKAAVDGLSIEDWLRRRIDQEILRRRNRYILAELVEQCDPQAPLSAEDREWLGSNAIGRELLCIGTIIAVDRQSLDERLRTWLQL